MNTNLYSDAADTDPLNVILSVLQICNASIILDAL